MTQRRRRRVRRQLLELLESGSTVSQACAAVGISRRTFYTWLQDAEWREAVDCAYTRLIATAERTLHRAIEQGDTRAAMWLLERLAPEYRLTSHATPNLREGGYKLEFEVVDAPDLGNLEQLLATGA